MPHKPNSLINTKNCYMTVDGSMRRKKGGGGGKRRKKKKKNLIKEWCYRGEKK